MSGRKSRTFGLGVDVLRVALGRGEVVGPSEFSTVVLRIRKQHEKVSRSRAVKHVPGIRPIRYVGCEPTQRATVVIYNLRVVVDIEIR